MLVPIEGLCCFSVHVSQSLRLSCILYVSALEVYWCTEASAALLLSLSICFRTDPGLLYRHLTSCKAVNHIIFCLSTQNFIKINWANSGHATLVPKNLIADFLPKTLL